MIQTGANSTESKLYALLNNAKVDLNDKSKNWITLDRTFFETGKASLLKTSSIQVNNFKEILNAYPNASLKIGGYTDNTGNADLNQKLSNNRANAFYEALKASGINSDRMKAEGYGSQHPICKANDTDICKAQNRRIDVRLMTK